jgi:hypothetical protein
VRSRPALKELVEALHLAALQLALLLHEALDELPQASILRAQLDGLAP